jgi:hypothetical protein
MSTRDKLEQVLEMLVNEENDKASELLHDVFVEKAKNIYAELVEADESVEEDVTEDFGGDPEQDLADDISADGEEIEAEEMFSEEDMDDEEAEDDLAADMDVDAEGEEAEGGDIDAAMMNVEDALDELKAAFADMMGGEGDEEEGEEAEEMDMEMEMESADELDEDFEDLEEAASLTAVKNPSDPVGSDAGAQKSPVAGKNDMGGTASNIAQGGEDSGRSAPAAKDMGSTTQPAPRSVKADHKDGTDNGKSPIGSK